MRLPTFKKRSTPEKILSKTQEGELVETPKKLVKGINFKSYSSRKDYTVKRKGTDIISYLNENSYKE
jgi:hypothetical protein